MHYREVSDKDIMKRTATRSEQGIRKYHWGNKKLSKTVSSKVMNSPPSAPVRRSCDMMEKDEQEN